MTKEEKIKEAWGDNYPPNGTDDNGWSKDDVDYGTFDVKLFDYIPYMKSALIRPKSLQGIENNNGWIKIESEDDLPKKNDTYFTKTRHDDIIRIEIIATENLDSKGLEWYKNHYSHYQPIIKPKNPLY